MDTSKFALPKPKDKPRARKPNPQILPDGRIIFRKPSPAWTAHKQKIYQRDRGRCVKCGPDSKPLYFNSGNEFLNAQFDHIKEKRMGRNAFTDDREENIQTVCDFHHRRKHDKGF